jgi:cardiolipin synthetase
MEDVVSRIRKHEKMNIPPLSITIFLIIVQLLILIGVYYYMEDLQDIFNISWHIISVVAAIFVINKENENSAYKIAWIMPMCIFPIVGLILYVIIKVFSGSKLLTLMLRDKIRKSRVYISQNNATMEEFAKLHPEFAGMANYLFKHEYFPIYADEDVTYYPLGELVFNAIKEEILKAKDYIFMEFFIVSQGELLTELLDMLEKKVEEGVEVRLLYDGSNMFSLPKHYYDYICSKGIYCKIFSPVTAILSSYQNNRDHRKIVVVDGKVAFTGGINIADEYVNRKVRFGHWKDCGVKIVGEGVYSILTQFLQIWNIDVQGNIEDYEQYLTTVKEEKKYENYNNFLIPYSDYPNEQNDNPAEAIYIHILFYAKKYVNIMTPYLIIDDELMMAMRYASSRGVRVRLLLPGIPDKKIPYLIAQSYFLPLLHYGVEIYTYTKGFVHSKVFVSDDVVCTVGTVNLDYRSLYLHFENGVFFYNEELAKTINEDFEKTVAESKKVTIEEVRNMSKIKKYTARILKLLAPLM